MLAAVAKMEVLSAPDHRDGTTPEVVYSVLSAEALLREGITPREDGMWYGYCEICVNKSPNASIRTPRLTSSTSSAEYVSSTQGPARESAEPSKIHAVALSQDKGDTK